MLDFGGSRRFYKENVYMFCDTRLVSVTLYMRLMSCQTYFNVGCEGFEFFNALFLVWAKYKQIGSYFYIQNIKDTYNRKVLSVADALLLR